MTDTIVSREKVKREARAAAKTYDKVNDACPYPFGSPAGQVFKDEFLRARAEMDAAGYSNTVVAAQAPQTQPEQAAQ